MQFRNFDHVLYVLFSAIFSTIQAKARLIVVQPCLQSTILYIRTVSWYISKLIIFHVVEVFSCMLSSLASPLDPTCYLHLLFIYEPHHRKKKSLRICHQVRPKPGFSATEVKYSLMLSQRTTAGHFCVYMF